MKKFFFATIVIDSAIVFTRPGSVGIRGERGQKQRRL